MLLNLFVGYISVYYNYSYYNYNSLHLETIYIQVTDPSIAE